MKNAVMIIIFWLAVAISAQSLPSGAIDGVEDLPANIKAPDSSRNIDYNVYYDAARRASQNDNSSSTLKALGTTMFLTGLASIVLTIADANKSESIQIDKTTKLTVKNKWSTIHTALAIIGGGMVVGGAFTWTF